MKLILGDCLEKLKSLSDSSIDAVITDPPYGMSQHSQTDIVAALTAWLAGNEYTHGSKGFMGKEWDSFVPSPTVWREVLRVLKPGGHILCAASSRISDLMGISLRLAGFEIRDTIEWVYGSGFPKSLNVGKAIDKAAGVEREVVGVSNNGSGASPQKLLNREKGDTGIGMLDGSGKTFTITEGSSEFEGQGTALKPAHEPFILARKPLEKGLTVAENCLKWGTGGIEIDGCRVDTDDNLNGGAYSGGSRSDGDWKENSGFKNDSLTEYQPPDGRFPANVIHDGSDCVVNMFPDSKGQQGDLKGHKTKRLSPNGCYGEFPPAADAVARNDSGSAARFFYCAKASKKERGVGNTHPTVKPIALMEYLVKLICREGQTVLDPFMGSGTTGVAAQNLNRHFIGIEKDETYFNIAHDRIYGEI